MNTSDYMEGYDNVSDSSPTYDDYEMGLMCDKLPVRELRGYLEPPLYCAIVILGGLGNLMVIWIYLHFRQRLKTMTDVYLLNLAVADLLFLVTLPLWASEATQGWVFGQGLCKVTSAFYKINLFSSMLLLTCISIDRYVAIVQITWAQNFKRQRLSYSKIVCIVVWLLSLALAIPEFIFATIKDQEGTDYCTLVYENNKNNRTKILVLVLQICAGFCLPFLIMIFCYTAIIRTLLKTKNFQKHKALRVILVVVAVFVLSQLPYNSVLVVEATQATNMTLNNCEASKRFDMIGQVMKSLAYTHACLNPFLYTFVGVRFRKDLIKILRSCSCWFSQGKLSKFSGPLRSSVMSDTDTTQALSL